MSEEALVETIRTHLNVLKAEGRRWVIAVPGNMGAGFLQTYLKSCPGKYKSKDEASGICDQTEPLDRQSLDCSDRNSSVNSSEQDEQKKSLEKSLVTMSNFVGKTIDIAAELGFSGIVIAGHMGKLVKS